jgi:hypothetical protein
VFVTVIVHVTVLFASAQSRDAVAGVIATERLGRTAAIAVYEVGEGHCVPQQSS